MRRRRVARSSRKHSLTPAVGCSTRQRGPCRGPKEEPVGDAVPPGSGSGHVPGEGPSQAGMKTPRFQGAMRAPPIFLQKARLPNVSFEEPGPWQGMAGASQAGLWSPAMWGSHVALCPPPPPSHAYACGWARGCEEPFHQHLPEHLLSSQPAHEGCSHSPLGRCGNQGSRGWKTHPKPSRQ